MEDDPTERRKIFKKEDPTKGLAAVRPDRGMTVDGHVRTGSNNLGS